MKKRNLVVAIGFFIFWLLILMAGADFPPPSGFIWIVLINAICALVVYWRIDSYMQWVKIRRKRRILLVLADGLIAGFVVAGVVMIFSPGEPSVEPRLVDRLIWFAVLGFMGALNSSVVYAISAALTRKE